MSKKGKKKSRKTADKLVLATALVNLLMVIIELISKMFD